MKTILLIAMIASITIGYCYQWQTALAEDVNINNAAYYMTEDSFYGVYCGDCVIYVDENGFLSEYDVYLPVQGAQPLNDHEFLFVMGAGSESDGIYIMNMETDDFEVVLYTYFPTFITYCDANEYYYSGDDSGLWISNNGNDWSLSQEFDQTSCNAMSWNGSNFVVAADDAVFVSHNAGETWEEAEYAPWICDFAWSLDGSILYGIFPDMSYSSGIWRSLDYGENWEVVMWDVMMSCVTVDISGEVFIGYEETAGVGIMDLVNGEASMINDGLSNLNINKLITYPLVDCPAVLACTDGGAYFVTDYSMGTTDEDIPHRDALANVYPNPFNPETIIELDLPRPQPVEVNIYNSRGQLVNTLSIPETESKTVWNGTDQVGHPVASGVYLIRIETAEQTIIRKALLMK